MPVFYPSVQIALWIRVEEFARTASLDGQLGAATRAREPERAALTPPSTPTATAEDALARLAALNDQIRAVQQYPPDDEAERERILSELRAERDAVLASIAAGGQQRRPESLSGSSPDDRFVRGGIIPLRCVVERNGFRTADTASIELAWEDIPFDPRLLRSFGVEVILGTVRGSDYDEGLRGLRNEQGQLRSLVSQSPGGSVVRAATRYVGKVDQVDVKFDGDEGAILSLETRDLTCVFIDQPLITPDLDLSLPIDVGIQMLLLQYPALTGMPVIFGDVNDPSPGPAPIPGAAVALPRRARRGRVTRQARSGDQKMSLWDYLTDVCVQVGMIPLVRDYELRICRPETLYGMTSTPIDPEQGDAGGVGSRPRRMVYGRNIEELSFSRKLGGTKVPTIEVRAYDPLIGRTRWARWPTRAGEPSVGVLGINDPPQALRANEISPTGANPDEKVQTFTVRYATDPSMLRQIARSTYEEIGRQEITGSFKTSDLTSFESLLEADLLQLESGDPVEILVDAYDPTDPDQAATSATELAALETNRRTAYLQDLGWPADTAARFAQLQNASGLQSVFRTSSVRIDFDSENGMDIEVEFQNYVEVRAEPVTQETASAGTAARARGADSGAGAAALSASQRRRQIGRYALPDPELGDVDASQVIPNQETGDFDARSVTPDQELGDYESALGEERRAVQNLGRTR